MVVHGDVDTAIASPQRGEVGGGNRVDGSLPRAMTACRATPHLASPRWGEVRTPTYRAGAGERVWRRLEKLSRKSPKSTVEDRVALYWWLKGEPADAQVVWR